jgi:hypothetical protein
MNKFDYILCELHYPFLHGKTVDSDKHIETHYIVIGKFYYKTGYTIEEYYEYDTDSEYDSDTDYKLSHNIIPNIHDSIKYYKNIYNKYVKKQYIHRYPHSTIRNYAKIVNSSNYIKPEIAQCIQLKTGEEIAILKTFWIRIIQKTWKKVFKIRKQLAKRYEKINGLELKGLLHMYK